MTGDAGHPPESDVQPAIKPVDALLAIEVGNTRIGLGIWDADGLHDVRRVATQDASEWSAAIGALWQVVSRAPQRAIAIGSVVPKQAEALTDVVREVSGREPHFVRDDLPLPLKLEIDNAREVGVDRVCSAAAAHERLRTACAVASFGTAITIDCVSEDGRFLGGAILPGIEMSCAALHAGTAALPHIQAEAPRSAFGRNTHDAIAGGVVYGAVGALREIVERFATELGHWPALMLTGGNAPLIAEQADFVDAIVPDLCLMGVALAYRRAAGQP